MCMEKNNLNYHCIYLKIYQNIPEFLVGFEYSGGAAVFRATVLRYHLYLHVFLQSHLFLLEYLPTGFYFTVAFQLAFLT